MSSSSSSPSSPSASSLPSSPSSSDQNPSSFFSRMEELIKDHKRSFMKSIKDFKRNLNSLQKSLLQLNAKTSDVEKQIKLLERSGQKKRKRDVEEWLTQVKSVENEVAELHTLAESHRFVRNLMDGGKVARLNEKVVELIQQSQHLDGCGIRGVELLTTKMVGYAFEGNCKNILSLLARREVSSIGIYGMGGVGKTALANCINNRLVKQSQVRVFWIVVSQEFTIKDLQDKIACFLGLDLSGENDEDLRAVKLHKALSQMKNSVLILDDVWKNIDMLNVGCPVSKECCRLIITTRSLEVCHLTRCQEVIRVKTLDVGDEWELFTETINLGDQTELSPDVKSIAVSVLSSCDGLPLGIIKVAENMRGKTSIHAWKAALEELKEPLTRQGGIGDGEIFRVLKYSFDRLNDQSEEEFNLIQLCFLYCSVFPLGSLPDKDYMVERFISEGLMDRIKSRRAQVHQGYSILDKLVNLSLLDKEYGDYNPALKMHNLIRSMALRINEGKYMGIAGQRCWGDIPDEEEWTKDLEKVALVICDITTIPDGMSPDCPNLSTLLLYNNPLEAVPDSFFSKMQGLCTLNLSFTDIRMLPDSLSELRSLKSLHLEYCECLEKGPYLGKMRALRELDLTHTAIKEVPQGVEELCTLRFLSIDGTYLMMVPGGLLLKLGNLEYLRFPIHMEVSVEEIVNLVKLDDFGGRLNDVRSLNLFIESKPRDAFYHVQVGEYYKDGAGMTESYDRLVYLSKCNLKDEKVLGSGIENLTIRECEGLSNCLLDVFPPTCYPVSLKALAIKRCGGIECVLTSSQGSQSRFLTLQSIELKGLQDFRQILKTELGAPPARAVFAHLIELKIENCNKIKNLGLPIRGVPNLDHLEVSKCGEIEEVFEDEGEGPVPHPKLRRLSLLGLPRLKRICGATMICNSLKVIRFLQCPSLMEELPKLPMHLEFDVPTSPPPSGRDRVALGLFWWSSLEIKVEREWWESLEWDNTSLLQLLQPFVTFEPQ